MLKENLHNPDKNRRWFFDDYFDLIIWYGADQAVAGFQLCYDLAGAEHALTWKKEKGLEHHRIDGGEDSPLKNRTPVLISDGAIPHDKLVREFTERAASLEPALYELVMMHLRNDRQVDHRKY